MKRCLFVCFFISTIFGDVLAQSANKSINTGNNLYEKEKYVDAEIQYRNALIEKPISKEANFNLGNALYKQNKFANAREQYEIT
jgi:tetratricopeptide (TPR) repeat protein